MNNQHYKYVCQFGVMHSQCRCPSKDKATKPIICNKPKAHRPREDK